MTNDYDERTSLNAYRIILANVGILLRAAVFALLADGASSVLYLVLGSESAAYGVASVIFGVLALAIMLICGFSVKNMVMLKWHLSILYNQLQHLQP
jgi:Na+/melibiose symporter-like transporter